MGNRNRLRPHHPKTLIEQARQLWNDGLTASEISRRMIGLTRNAICGIAYRNDFKPRTSPIRRVA